MSGDRFVVEANRKVVGIAVRVPGGFRFFSSDPDFHRLEAKMFPRARAIVRRVAEIAKARAARRWPEQASSQPALNRA